MIMMVDMQKIKETGTRLAGGETSAYRGLNNTLHIALFILRT